jgi:nucleoside diphosphate kinase
VRACGRRPPSPALSPVNVHELLEPPITTDPDRRRLYPEDVYFRELAEQLGEFDPAALRRILDHGSFLLFKPEAVAGRRIERALDYAAGQGFEPLGALRVRIDPRTLREMWRYQLNAAPLSTIRAVDMIMASGDCLFVAVYDTRGPEHTGQTAAARLSELKGSTRDLNTELGHGLLREELGCTIQSLNFVHAPDEPADLLRELAVLFDWPGRAEPLRILSTLPSPQAREAVRREAKRLYSRHPQHPLDLAGSIKALRAAAQDDPERAAMTARLLHALEHLPGPESELLRLVDWLDYAPSRLGTWDRITLASYLVDKQSSDRMPLIGPPPGKRAVARRKRAEDAAAAKAQRANAVTDVGAARDNALTDGASNAALRTGR